MLCYTHKDWGRLSSMAGVKDLFWWWERSSFLCILICWVIIPAVNSTTLLADAVTSKQPRLSVRIRSSKLLICVVQGWPHFLSSAYRRNASLAAGFLVRQHKLDELFLHPAHSWTGPLLWMYWHSMIFCSRLQLKLDTGQIKNAKNAVNQTASLQRCSGQVLWKQTEHFSIETSS